MVQIYKSAVERLIGVTVPKRCCTKLIYDLQRLVVESSDQIYANALVSNPLMNRLLQDVC